MPIPPSVSVCLPKRVAKYMLVQKFGTQHLPLSDFSRANTVIGHEMLGTEANWLKRNVWNTVQDIPLQGGVAPGCGWIKTL